MQNKALYVPGDTVELHTDKEGDNWKVIEVEGEVLHLESSRSYKNEPRRISVLGRHVKRKVP